MQTENQIEKDQTPANANADAQQLASQEAKYKEAQRVVSFALRADGTVTGSSEQAANVSHLLKVRPDLRSEILAILHENADLGNSFVQMVLHPAGHGPKNAVNGGATGAANATAPAPPAPSKLSAEGQATANAAMESSVETGDREKWATKGGAAGAAAAAPTNESSKDAAAPAPEAAKPQMDAATQAAPPAPVAQGPKPGPDSAETKQQEPAPQHPKEPVAPANEVAPPGKQDIASASQTPAPPTQEAAPKNDAAEKAKEEKPETKEGVVKITASALRVRAEPNTKGAVLGKIPRGGTAKVVGHHGSWLKIDHEVFGISYIHGKYTTSVKGNESGEEEEEHQSEGSHETKPERPKSSTPQNDDQQNVLV